MPSWSVAETGANDERLPELRPFPSRNPIRLVATRRVSSPGRKSMTDSRLPDRWLTNHSYLDLSDTGWRLFTYGLMWSNQQGTDGRIPKSCLRVLGQTVDGVAVNELVAAGKWAETFDGFQFVGDWEVDLGQSWAGDVENKRALNRDRQRAFRARAAVEGDSPSSEGSVTRYVGQAGKDSDRSPGCRMCGESRPLDQGLCMTCSTEMRPI